MLGNFFNSFYYGKAGKGDYRPEDLPANRVQLFFEMLRVRWSGVIRVNLLYILFWIPAILWSWLNASALMNLIEVSAAGVEAAAELAAELSAVSLGEQAYGLLFTYLLGMIPCIAITGPATAGVTYIMRNWARDQHCFIMSDFKDAFKANWKQALGVSAITGFVPFMVLVCWRFYGQMSAQSYFFIVPQALIVLLGVVWLLALEIIYSLMITYSLKFGQLLRNSLILSVGKLPMSVGIRLISLILPAAVVVLTLYTTIYIYAILVAVLFYLLIGFGLNRFLYASYANSLCDKYINPRIDGAPVNMGLRQVTEEDYEDDPTLPQSIRDEQAGKEA